MKYTRLKLAGVVELGESAMPVGACALRFIIRWRTLSHRSARGCAVKMLLLSDV